MWAVGQNAIPEKKRTWSRTFERKWNHTYVSLSFCTSVALIGHLNEKDQVISKASNMMGLMPPDLALVFTALCWTFYGTAVQLRISFSETVAIHCT